MWVLSVCHNAFCLYSTRFFQLPSIYVYVFPLCNRRTAKCMCCSLTKPLQYWNRKQKSVFSLKVKKARPKNVLQDVVLLTHVRQVRLGTEGNEFWAGHERIIIKGERAFALFFFFFFLDITNRFTVQSRKLLLVWKTLGHEHRTCREQPCIRFFFSSIFHRFVLFLLKMKRENSANCGAWQKCDTRSRSTAVTIRKVGIDILSFHSALMFCFVKAFGHPPKWHAAQPSN